MTRVPDASTLRVPLACLVSGVAVVQVLGRMLAVRSVLRRLGPIIFGTCVLFVLVAELALCYPLLAPFDVWPKAVQKQIAVVARLWKRCLWPLVLWCCPWISVEVRDRHLLRRMGSDRTRGTVLVMNHTSFFDAPFALCFFPWRVAALHRVLAMASVMRMPLIGQLFKSERHIPVHFASDGKDSFKLKAGTKEQTEAGIVETMLDKEVLVVYPEGQINNREPRQLAPFRHGTFKCAIQHDAVIWGWIAVGVDTVWPYGAAMGGNPAKITASPVEIAPEGTHEYMRRHGVPMEPRDGQSPEELLAEQTRRLTELVQADMQAVLTRIHDERATEM